MPRSGIEAASELSFPDHHRYTRADAQRILQHCDTERLVRAIGWLKSTTATRAGKIATVLRALLGGGSDDGEALERMGLQAPKGAGAWLESRLLALALRSTQAP